MLICRGNPPPENNDQNNTMAIRNGVVATNNLMMQLRFGGLTRGNARQKQKKILAIQSSFVLSAPSRKMGFTTNFDYFSLGGKTCQKSRQFGSPSPNNLLGRWPLAMGSFVNRDRCVVLCHVLYEIRLTRKMPARQKLCFGIENYRTSLWLSIPCRSIM